MMGVPLPVAALAEIVFDNDEFITSIEGWSSNADIVRLTFMTTKFISETYLFLIRFCRAGFLGRWGPHGG